MTLWDIIEKVVPKKNNWNRYDRESRTRGYEMGYNQALDDLKERASKVEISEIELVNVLGKFSHPDFPEMWPSLKTELAHAILDYLKGVGK